MRTDLNFLEQDTLNGLENIYAWYPFNIGLLLASEIWMRWIQRIQNTVFMKHKKRDFSLIGASEGFAK